MSFDGLFLHHLKQELQILKSGRLVKIAEIGDTDFIFTIRSDKTNHQLMLSFASDFARVNLKKKKYDTSSHPKSFTMLLRKHLEGYFLKDFFQYESDRILVFMFTGYNEMRDYNQKYLICEVMGRYSNLILTTDTYSIIDVLKKDGVGEYNRTMLPNAIYRFPETNKKNPLARSLQSLQQDTVFSPKDLIACYNGISMLAAEYCFQTDAVHQTLYQLIHETIHPVILLNKNQKKDFYFQACNNPVLEAYPSLSALLDQFYYEAEKTYTIKQKTQDIGRFVDRQILKNTHKIQKLNQEMLSAMHADEYRLYGELLMSYPHLKEKAASVTVLNYYTHEMVLIPLDAKYDIITNSQKYFKKYQKAKSAIHYIQEQIQKSKEEIEYFQLLQFQLNQCSLQDAMEIKQELINHKYMLAKTTKNVKKQKPHLLSYLIDDVVISVGKNNLQNEYLTHKLAKPNDYWFHVKDAPGSHVVVHSDQLNENLIRSAAMLAACFSSYKDSSSVPVDYTQIRYIKKIPQRRSCFVTYSKQKTIFIDPNPQIFATWKVKK